MIFDFENDFAGSLRCIPMVVRQKLDLVGIKLSLKQWSRFPHEERTNLVDTPYDPGPQHEAYRRTVLALIETHTSEPPSFLHDPELDAWRAIDHIPASVEAQAQKDGIPSPSLTKWASLTPLQRFALVKLSRSKHENANFVPAMREFGLLGETDPSPVSSSPLPR